jgi:NAD-dependent deacetylase sirtuin 5
MAGFSQRAKHPKDRLYELHGSLMAIKCTNTSCDYVEKENLQPSICPALAIDTLVSPPKDSTAEVASKLSSLTVKDSEAPVKPAYESRPNPLQEILVSLAPIITDEMRKEVIPVAELPHCPKCNSLLRPGVVMFGEPLSQAMFDEINAWIDAEKKLDLMLVIGTTAQVYPAARFVQRAKEKGARIAVINMDAGHLGDMVVRKQDWVFEGNAAEILPVLFEGTLEN